MVVVPNKENYSYEINDNPQGSMLNPNQMTIWWLILDSSPLIREVNDRADIIFHVVIIQPYHIHNVCK